MGTNKGLKLRKTNLPLYLFIGLALTLIFSPGCDTDKKQVSPQELAKESQDFYQRAITAYQEEIRAGEDTDSARLNLGKLYFDHGDFKDAAAELSKSSLAEAEKYLAISYYYLGDYTRAYDIFGKSDQLDDQGRYCLGLTCEELNLYDQALETYGEIKGEEFKGLAKIRSGRIEKDAAPLKIKQLDPEIYEIIEQSPGEEEFPQAGALILLADEKIEVTEEGREVSELHYLVKILNERGKESFAESLISYDTTYERIELEFARTIKPDGAVVDVGARHIRDVSKYLNFPLYSNAHVYIISFPEITEEAVIEYKVKIYRSQLINKDDLVLSYPIQSAEPIIKEDFELILPKGKELNLNLVNQKYNTFGAVLSPKIIPRQGKKAYSWSFSQIPQIIPESNMPPENRINPAIIMSTFKDWQEIYNWWWALTEDKISPDKAIKDKVRQLTEKKSLPEEKIRAIYNFCAKEIRYVGVEYGQAGYEPHKAGDIFKNKYGDCKDQAVLLVTMLGEAGFTAYPVLIPTRDTYNLRKDFPSMLFDHAIAVISYDHKLIFMDPTAETCSFGDLPTGDQNRNVLICKPDGYLLESTPLYPAEHNLLKQELKLEIAEDESITAQKKITASGVYGQSQRYWLLYTPPELISDALGEAIQAISIGAKLQDYQISKIEDLDQPVVLNYDFSGLEYLTDAGALRIMPQLSSLDTSVVAKDKRRYPIDLGFLESKEAEFDITIPKDFVVKYIPEQIDEDSPWIKFFLSYSQKDGDLNFRQKTALKKVTITEEEYADFKIFFERLAKKIKQRVVLEKSRR